MQISNLVRIIRFWDNTFQTVYKTPIDKDVGINMLHVDLLSHGNVRNHFIIYKR